MIKNQWYAIFSSHEIKQGKIVAARRFGEDLVVFRSGDGVLSCLTAKCAHRGASLAKGCISDGGIVCPFHGIEYASDGRCIYIPSEGRGSKSDFGRFDLKHYELREIGGIVFAWYGDGSPDCEPDVFDIVRDESYSYDHINDTWNIHYSRVIENQLDVSHLPFVHSTTIGRGGKTLCNGPRVIWPDQNTLRTSADNEVDKGQQPAGAEDSKIKDTNLTFRFPNMWLNHVTDKIQILAFFIPVDDDHSIIALRFYNRITGIRAVDKMIAWLGSRANRIVERQDKRIVETQYPAASGLYMNECLVAADLPIMEYRRRRHELQTGKEASAEKEDSRGEASQSHTGSKKGVRLMDNKAMYKLSYGLFVLTAADETAAKAVDAQGSAAKAAETAQTGAVAKTGINGCITNTAIQVASEPNQISFAVNKANYTHDMIIRTMKCNISVISEDADFELFRHFGFQSGRDIDKFAGYTDCKYADNGIPYITKGTNAYFSIDVKQTVDLGSHTLFIGEPTAMEVLTDAPSATYTYYQSNIKPRPEAPKAEDKLPEGMHKWRCKICGYEYIGETLPDDYICPLCKHPASDFELVE